MQHVEDNSCIRFVERTDQAISIIISRHILKISTISRWTMWTLCPDTEAATPSSPTGGPLLRVDVDVGNTVF